MRQREAKVQRCDRSTSDSRESPGGEESGTSVPCAPHPNAATPLIIVTTAPCTPRRFRRLHSTVSAASLSLVARKIYHREIDENLVFLRVFYLFVHRIRNLIQALKIVKWDPKNIIRKRIMHRFILEQHLVSLATILPDFTFSPHLSKLCSRLTYLVLLVCSTSSSSHYRYLARFGFVHSISLTVAQSFTSYAPASNSWHASDIVSP